MQSIFVVILKACTTIVNSPIPFVLRLLCVEISSLFYSGNCRLVSTRNRRLLKSFADKPIDFYKFSLYLLLLILVVSLHFVLFLRICLSAQERAHLMGITLMLNVDTLETSYICIDF